MDFLCHFYLFVFQGKLLDGDDVITIWASNEYQGVYVVHNLRQ